MKLKRFNLLDDFFTSDLFFNHPTLRPREIAPINIKEGESEYILDLAMPGVDKTKFNIKLEDDILTLSFSETQTDEDEFENYFRKEFGYQSFERKFKLPKDVNRNKISAEYLDGILKIKISKDIKKMKDKIKVIQIE